MKRNIDENKLFAKLCALYPKNAAKTLMIKMLDCCDELYTNLVEWVQGEPLSDVLINDKYCVNAVLKIRGNGDFVDAFLTLQEYSQDESAEYLIWKQRM